MNKLKKIHGHGSWLVCEMALGDMARMSWVV